MIKVWQRILSDLEDRRAATVLTSIDYAKAFNRLSFQHCLAAFARRGASRPVLKLLAAFLTGRTMKVRVGSAWSSSREVTGGCPQGSILGVLLFNIATDDLEEGSDYVSFVDRPDVCCDGEEEDEDHYGPEADSPNWGGMGAEAAPSEDDTFYSAGSDVSEDCSDQLQSSRINDSGGVMESSLSPIRRPDIFDFDLGPSDGNVRRRRRVVYSSEGDVTPPPEPTTTCLGAWKPRLVDVDKYVDDNLQQEAVNMENAMTVQDGQERWKVKHAVPTQNVFRYVVGRAEERGMKVNTAKTGMVCISDSLNTRSAAFILDREGNKIESGQSLKVLGWHFSDRPTPDAQIAVLKKRFRERYWVLRHLKHNGFETEDLLKVYASMLRPVADYMSKVYHSMITDSQDEAIERLQTHALRCIYGARLSGRRMREMAGIETLRQRRIGHCDKFAAKCVQSVRFSGWFPENVRRRSTRNREEYLEEYARCNRLMNSPLFYMRRRLNGKPGRTYGQRTVSYTHLTLPTTPYV